MARPSDAEWWDRPTVVRGAQHARRPAAPIVQVVEEDKLREMIEKLEALTDETSKLEQDAVHARHVCDMAVQQEMLKLRVADGKMPVDLLKASASTTHGQLLLTAKSKEAELSACQNAQRNLRSLIDAQRSLLASVRGQT